MKGKYTFNKTYCDLLLSLFLTSVVSSLHDCEEG